MELTILSVIDVVEKIGIGNFIAVWLLFKTSQQLQENNKLMSEMMKMIKEMHDDEGFYQSRTRTKRDSGSRRSESDDGTP